MSVGILAAAAIHEFIGAALIVFFGIGFTTLVMGLASVGIIGPILAAASQSVPDVAVALNASRLLRRSPKLE